MKQRDDYGFNDSRIVSCDTGTDPYFEYVMLDNGDGNPFKINRYRNENIKKVISLNELNSPTFFHVSSSRIVVGLANGKLYLTKSKSYTNFTHESRITASYFNRTLSLMITGA